MKGVAMVVLMMLAMVGFLVHPSESLSCPQVDMMLEPCLPYLKSGGTPTDNCCNGLKTLKLEAQSTSDRQTACNCAKEAARRFQIGKAAAVDLPSRCGMTFNVPIDPNVDCSTITMMGTSGVL